MKRSNIWIVLLLLVFSPEFLMGQYFGQNKPRYSKQNFEVLETENFEIYHYLHNNDALIQRLAVDAERWYQMHLQIMKDTIEIKNPLIFYNDHADFQQTNTIFGSIGVGTGGVTEGLKNRVIMPIAMTNQQTNHVLGHELVHAFQFNSLINGDSTNIQNIQNIPLWFIEGMAEYMSLGRMDPHTAMWMRDAVLNDDVPEIHQLVNYSKYFPYRFGQAFLAFLAGTYGDDVIRPFMMETAKVGMEAASMKVLGVQLKDLSTLWVQTIKRGYAPWLEGKKERPLGKELISDKNAGKLNISPVVSPNGRYVIFLSEKNLFTTDLYLADTRSGKIIRKVASSTKNSEIDAFNYMESSGTWSPDSKQFAFSAYKKGKNILVVYDVLRGKKVKEIVIPGVHAFSNPAWSPDGMNIAVTGLVNGQTDIFLYNFKTQKARKLTDDPYSELHPSWSKDGRYLVFSTDQLSFDKEKEKASYTFNIARMDIDYERVELFDFFYGANNMNPLMEEDDLIYFLSDRDGFRNLYKYDTRTKNLFQLTHFLTGISGITPYAPAISLGGQAGRLVYTHFFNRSYTIYTIMTSALSAEQVSPLDIQRNAAMLPPGIPRRSDIIDSNLNQFRTIETSDPGTFVTKAYRSKFKLDYIGGGTGMGMNTSSAFGTNTGIAGGIDMLFSDILGDQMLFAGIAVNGEIYDAGAQLMYLNRKNRLAWGISASHIPFRTGFVTYRGPVLLQDQSGNQIQAFQYDVNLNRVYQDQINLIFNLPFSVSRRIEFGGGYSLFYERRDLISNYYDQFNRLILQERNRLSAPGSLSMFNTNTAFVGDNAIFGMASPMLGGRYRISGELFFGDLQFQTTLADFRKYHYFKPVNISYRLLHYARYGRDAHRLFRLFPIDPMLVRGYSRFSLDEFRFNHNYEFNQLSGSRMLIGNFEVRLPFTGPKRLAIIPSNFLFTELALFADAGMAWSEWNDFGEGQQLKPAILASTGISLRINLLGALILEPFYAFPIVRGELLKGRFGFNLIPGW